MAAYYHGIIVFLTAFRGYVFRGYEVRALNYLLKPVKENTLFLCLDEIAKELSNNTYIYRNKREIVSIPYTDILTFSSRLHYVDILNTFITIVLLFVWGVLSHTLGYTLLRKVRILVIQI